MIENEDKEYEKEPEDMISKDNKRNYAYITLMMDVRYLPGALVMAESINKLGSQTDLVIMITEEIVSEIEDLLKRYYTKVIRINKIGKVDIKFNKIKSLKMVEYKKIILIDIDAIIIKYPDYIFTLEEPAGVRVPINTDIFYDKNKKEEYKSWFNNNRGYEGIYSGLLLLKPDKNKYQDLKKRIKNMEYKNFKDLVNKLGMKTNIDPRFVGLCSYMEDWNNLYGLQFTGDKPFFYESDTKIESRSLREDNRLWFYFYRLVLEKNSDLNFLENKELKEVNELMRYYVGNIGRNVIRINRLLKEKINTKVDDKYNNRLNKIFRTEKINKNYDYYHIDIGREYEITNINYKNDDIINTDINYEKLKRLKLNDCIEKYFITSGKIVIFFLIDDREDLIVKENNYKENVIKEYIFRLKKDSLINFLVNVDTMYVYEERINNFKKVYKNSEYYLRILILEFKVDQEFKIENKYNLKIFQNINEKIKILSILNDDKSIKKVFDIEINFIERYKNIKSNLRYQSLLKWIYNIYNGEQLENIKIVKNKNKEEYEYLVIDDNEYSNEISVRMIINKKIYFLDIIFSKSVFFKNKYNRYSKLIEMNKENTYKIDGLKFIELVDNNNKKNIHSI